MAKFSRDLLIISKRIVNDEYFVLRLQGGEEVSNILPGQFVQLRVDNSQSTFLRRPISVYSIDMEKLSFDLLIKIAGKGTEALSLLQEGDKLGVIYPLGNSFSLPAADEKVLLVGGGVGVAPLLLAAKYLKENGISVEFILGYRSAAHVVDLDAFSSLAETHISTEDGSLGEKGLVSEHSRFGKDDYKRIYCCGPDPMMKAVAKVSRAKGVHCELSLENLMACGFGACLCCIEETVRGNLCTCTDGPVFNLNELKWQI